MKSLFKIESLLLAFLVIQMMISCKNQKAKENDENFTGSSRRDDICNLLKKEDIQSVFEVSKELKIEQREEEKAICFYGWKAAGDEFLYYSVTLNFARGEKRTKSQIDALWKGQYDRLYHRHELQEVTHVGDKASWSKLGGGQLRVASHGFIFYISLSVTPSKDNPMNTKKMITKASSLAELVIDRM
ncbi:hypothetical protein RBU60_03275 [Mesonia sp. MT50]|uniref:Lipoprotein n=1 Tax=Mesonia profundi TaxID=3070998 RepID=A0ABU1A128_9FLAO|nr:hypothetical protein [Mesonia profundi]MDQ7916584.1 hypothetical protein [Mesonia profundi]